MANYCPVRWDMMFSRVTSLPLRCQWFTNRRSLYQNHHFFGAQNPGCSSKRYFCKGVPRLRYDSNCLWHLLAQSGSVIQISITLPLAVVLLQLLLQRDGRFNDHWISLVFKLRRVGHFGGLSDRKKKLINWLTKTPKTQSSVSLSVFSYIHASMPQDFLGQHGSTRHCATVISPFSLTFSRFDSHRTNPHIVNLLLALAPEQVLLETPESESSSSRDKERQTSTYLFISHRIMSYLHTFAYSDWR